MARMTFYPVGNADSSLIEFADGRLMLVDFFDRGDVNDEDDRRVDLPEQLRSVLEDAGRDSLDVVAFTHADNDHVQGAEDFFWFEHASKYQDSERVRIGEIWVPACFILEEGLEDSARVIRQEARHRLKAGRGIRVFANPGGLDDWLRSNRIDPKDRAHLITHAGQCVDSFVSRQRGQAEIFVHSPFSFQMEGENVQRNSASLVLHVTFFEGERVSRAFLGADATYDVWEGIVYKTLARERSDRLAWDVFRLSHHCSYGALSDVKGTKRTEPVQRVKDLFSRASKGCYLISSSDPVPAADTDQPPHRQAAAYYREVAAAKEGDFIVTMETPTVQRPKPIVVKIDANGATWLKVTGVLAGAGAVIAAASQRQGKWNA